MKLQEIHVTQLHINCGKPGLPRRCPIALATHDHLLGIIDAVRVNMTTLELIFVERSPEGIGVVARSERYRLPSNAREFLRDYDRFEPVHPFTFVIDPEKDRIAE